MTFIIRALLVSTAAFSLVACGSSSVSRAPSIPADEELLRVYSEGPDGTRDVGDALDDGGTLNARSVSRAGLSLNYGTGETGIADPSVAISKNASGELTVVIDGVPHVFSPDDRELDPDGSVYGYSVQDPDSGEFYSAFSYSGQLDEFLASGNGYAKVLGVQTNLTPGDADTRAFAVFGTETRDDALASLPTATYSGRSRIDMVPESGFVNNSTSRTVLNSNVSMTADFGDGKISGQMTDFTLREGQGNNNPVAGTVIMNTAKFNVNAFEGTLSADSDFSTSTGISSFDMDYSGAFYGPAAQEAAGGISGTAVRNGTVQNGAGFFIVYQD